MWQSKKRRNARSAFIAIIHYTSHTPSTSVDAMSQYYTHSQTDD